jgi:protein disulfide-isomerase-like protein
MSSFRSVPRLFFHVLLLLLTTLLLLLPGCSAVHLTVDNFDELTHDRTVFIKFYAPWCGHCRAMADDWAKLEADWAGHAVGLVAEVDCTADDGQPLCEDFEVQGFPTLVYGDPLSSESYDGPRDYESLSAFAKEHISTPVCSAGRIDACSEADRSVIESLQAKSDDELEEILTAVSEQVKKEEEDFEAQSTRLQEQYADLVTKFNGRLDDIKARHHFKFVEQIMTSRAGEAAVEEDATEGEL